jgi:hypothetical protein
MPHELAARHAAAGEPHLVLQNVKQPPVVDGPGADLALGEIGLFASHE